MRRKKRPRRDGVGSGGSANGDSERATATAAATGEFTSGAAVRVTHCSALAMWTASAALLCCRRWSLEG